MYDRCVIVLVQIWAYLCYMKIPISEVLDRIQLSSNDIDGEVPFAIEYTRADGSISSKQRVVAYRKKFMYQQQGSASREHKREFKTNLKANGLLLLHDLDNADSVAFNIPYWALRKFNGTKIHYE